MISLFVIISYRMLCLCVQLEAATSTINAALASLLGRRRLLESHATPELAKHASKDLPHMKTGSDTRIRQRRRLQQSERFTEQVRICA